MMKSLRHTFLAMQPKKHDDEEDITRNNYSKASFPINQLITTSLNNDYSSPPCLSKPGKLLLRNFYSGEYTSQNSIEQIIPPKSRETSSRYCKTINLCPSITKCKQLAKHSQLKNRINRRSPSYHMKIKEKNKNQISIQEIKLNSSFQEKEHIPITVLYNSSNGNPILFRKAQVFIHSFSDSVSFEMNLNDSMKISKIFF